MRGWNPTETQECPRCYQQVRFLGSGKGVFIKYPQYPELRAVLDTLSNVATAILGVATFCGVIALIRWNNQNFDRFN